jgi:hypothetical protein
VLVNRRESKDFAVERLRIEAVQETPCVVIAFLADFLSMLMSALRGRKVVANGPGAVNGSRREVIAIKEAPLLQKTGIPAKALSSALIPIKRRRRST